MIKVLKSIIIWLLIFPPCSIATDNSADDKRPPNCDEILQAVKQFEDILNKDVPNMEDYRSLYYGDGGSEYEAFIEDTYCQQVLKVVPDSIACIKGLNKYRGNIQPEPSLFLAQIKNLISENGKYKIRLYIYNQIKYCKKNRGMVRVEALSLLDNGRSKSLVLSFPCTIRSMRRDRIGIDEIDGNNIADYPLTITKPFTKSK